MEFNSKNNNSSSKEERHEFKLEDAMNQQIFYNNRKCIFDCIKSCGSINEAVLNITFSKGKSGLFARLFAPYHVTYSLIYKSSNGEPRICENFFEMEFSKEGSLIPKYIFEALQNKDTVNVSLDMTDLENLYNEMNIKVDEDATFESICSLCKRKNVDYIQLIDRVFYTRIVCYDSAKQEMGAIHIGALRRLPNGLAEKLYPGGSVEYTLQ